MSFDRLSDWGAQLLYPLAFQTHQQTSFADPAAWTQPMQGDLFGQPLFGGIVSHGAISELPLSQFDSIPWGVEYASPPSRGLDSRYTPADVSPGSIHHGGAQVKFKSTASSSPHRNTPRRPSYSQTAGKVAKARASFRPNQTRPSKRIHAPAHQSKRQSSPLGQVSYQRWDEFLQQGRQGSTEPAPSASLHGLVQWQDADSWARDIQGGADWGLQSAASRSRTTSVDSQLELARYKEFVVRNAFQVDEAESSIEIQIPSSILLSQREDFVEYQRSESTEEQGGAPYRKGSCSVDSDDGSMTPGSDRRDAAKPLVQRVRSSRKAMPEERRRQNHIRSEQRRRSRVEELYGDIRRLVPSLREARYTKSTTLELTAEWVRELSRGNEELRQQLGRIEEAPDS